MAAPASAVPAAAPAPAPAPVAPAAQPAPASTPNAGGSVPVSGDASLSDDDFWSGLESALSDGADDQPAADDQQPAAEDLPPAEPEEPEETPAEAPPAEPPAEDPFADEVAPSKQTDTEVTFPKAHADSLMRALDFQRLIEQQIPGATPEVLAKHYETQTMMDRMMADLDSGNPNQIAAFSRMLVNGPSRETPGIVAEQLMGVLPRVNPEAYKRISDGVMKQTVEDLYQEAIRTGDDNILAVAQLLEHRLNGTFRDRTNFQPQDPRDIELQQYRQRELERLRTESQRAQELQRQWVDASDEAVRRDGVLAVIEEALKPVAVLKDRDGGRDYAHMVRDMEDAVLAAFNANQGFKRKYNDERARAASLATDQARESLIASMKAFAGPIIKANRRKIVEPYYTKIKSQSRGAVERAAQAATRQAPGGGAPVSTAAVSGVKSDTYEGGLDELLSAASKPSPTRR